MISDKALSFLVAKAKRDALYYIAHNLTAGKLATEKRKAKSWYNVPGRYE